MSDADDLIQNIRQEVSHLGLRAEEGLADFIKRLHAKAEAPKEAEPQLPPDVHEPYPNS